MSAYQELRRRVLAAAYSKPIRVASHTRVVIGDLVEQGLLRRTRVNGQNVSVMVECTAAGRAAVELDRRGA